MSKSSKNYAYAYGYQDDMALINSLIAKISLTLGVNGS